MGSFCISRLHGKRILGVQFLHIRIQVHFLNLHAFPGQSKLCNTSVLIVGCGGLGCPSAIYLAAAGIGKCIPKL